MQKATFVIVTLLLFSSCTFYARKKTITAKPLQAGRTVVFISEDSVRITLHRDRYFAALKSDTVNAGTISRLDSLNPDAVIYLDSLYQGADKRQIYFQSMDFMVDELNNGRAVITDLSTGKNIKRYRRKINYYRPDLFEKSKLHYISYSSRRYKKHIYSKRYLMIHF